MVEQACHNKNDKFQTPNMMGAISSPTVINQIAPGTNNKSKKNNIIKKINTNPTSLSLCDETSLLRKDILKMIQSNVESL